MTKAQAMELRMALLLAGGGVKSRRLVAQLGSEDLRLERLRESGMPGAVIAATKAALDGPAQRMMERVEGADWRWVVPENEGWPAALRNTEDPPLGLFVRGRLAAAPVAAIVGSRRPSEYGRRVARHLAEAVATAGGIVASGMARGIDAEAHQGALAAGGESWAVWATGPDRVYPREHAQLAERLAEKGALVTEYPPGTPARKHHFLERNRLIAGLAPVVVVVEAAARSGALNTARQALDEGREVMAVPGSIFSEVAVGPNGLLRAGAAPITAPADIVEALGLKRAAAEIGVGDPQGDQLFGTDEVLTADEIADRLGESAEQALATVLRLELEGKIVQTAAGAFRRVN